MKSLLIPGIYHKFGWDAHQGGLEAFAVTTWKILNRTKNDSCTILVPADTTLEPVPYPLIKWKRDSKESNPTSKIASNEIDIKISAIQKKKFDYIINSADHDIPMKFTEGLIKLGVPYLHVVHIHPRGHARYYFWKKLFALKKEYPHIRIAVVSEYLKRKVFEQFGYDVDYVLPLGFDESLGEANFVQTPLNEVVYVGRVTMIKNVQHLTSWLDKTSYKLHLIGPRWSNINSIRILDMKWAHETLPSNVIEHGLKTQNELKHLVKDKLCLISPLPTETFSLAAFGAQKLGVPVVSIQKEKDEAINEYMIEGKTGFTVKLRPNQRLSHIEDKVLDAIEKCKTLDRKFIYEHFNKVYPSEIYERNLRDILNKCQKPTNELIDKWKVEI